MTMVTTRTNRRESQEKRTPRTGDQSVATASVPFLTLDSASLFPGKAQRQSVAPPTRDRSSSEFVTVPVLQRTIPRFALHAALRRGHR
jgi:hypothetical protein